MKKRRFPALSSDTVFFCYCSFLMSAYVEVRRYHVIVTLYNGYSIMYATFRFRKSDLLRDPSFIYDLDCLLHAGLDDDALLDAPVKRILCRMALRRLSARSVYILVDSYKCVSELFSR